jgi:hypothetical protein
VRDPFRPPAEKATEANAAGKTAYRQGRWDEAREQYRAALALDPEFLAPRLNVACSFVRQERFADATAEVVGLLDQAYVPWNREVIEAADLGALRTRPEMQTIRAAMATAASRWGEELEASTVFIARLRPPLRVPDGEGVFLLNPQQEVWAYTPRTRRYRQLTAEDGHVVALVRSGRRILYVTAEKLVRTARPGAAAREVALRGVTIHTLTLATMAPGPSAHLDGDVRALGIGPAAKDGFVLEREEDRAHGGLSELEPDGRLRWSRARPSATRALTYLRGSGVEPPRAPAAPQVCPFGPAPAAGRVSLTGLPLP